MSTQGIVVEPRIMNHRLLVQVLISSLFSLIPLQKEKNERLINELQHVTSRWIYTTRIFEKQPLFV